MWKGIKLLRQAFCSHDYVELAIPKGRHKVKTDNPYGGNGHCVYCGKVIFVELVMRRAKE